MMHAVREAVAERLRLIGLTTGQSPTALVLAKRVSQPMLRASYTCFLWQALAGGHWTSGVGLASAVEVLMTSYYQLNKVVDQKGGVSEAEGMRYLLSTYLPLRDMAQNLFRTFLRETACSNRLMDELEGQFLDINRQTELGLEMDLYRLTWDRRNESFLVLEEEYERRCYLMDAFLFEQVARIVCKINGDRSEVQGGVTGFAKSYGIALQMLNDLVDFVPEQTTSEKLSCDWLKDLRNGRLTRPIYLAWQCGSEECRSLMLVARSGQEFSVESGWQLLRLLVEEGHFEVCKSQVRAWSNKARSCIKVLDRRERELLVQMCAMFRSSRYYHVAAAGVSNEWL